MHASMLVEHGQDTASPLCVNFPKDAIEVLLLSTSIWAFT